MPTDNYPIRFTTEKADLKRLEDAYSNYRVCKGGRIVHGMYCCLHCGSTDPSDECYSPRPDKK